MPDQKLKAALACALAGCLAVGAASASRTAEIETKNSLLIDTVDIDVRGSAEAESLVLYGTHGAACTTMIENRGAACWVRVRAETADGTRELVGTLAEDGADGSVSADDGADAAPPDDAATPGGSNGADDAAAPDPPAFARRGAPPETPEDGIAPKQARWMLGADGYYYLLDVLGEGESVAFTEIVSHPDDGTWDGEGFDAQRVVVAQAVQATAFQPDFDADLPWGDLEPEQAIYTREEGTADES